MNPLNDQQLDEIEQRANAATKGPWGFYDGDNYADVAADLTMTSRSSYSYREKIARLEDENYWDDPAHEDDDEGRASEQMVANAAFIAHARTDVEQLVAEVRRLRAELERARTAALHEAADVADGATNLFTDSDEGAAAAGALEGLAIRFRRMADAAQPPAEETHVVADDSDDPEHIDDCPGYEARPAVRPAVETGA